MLFGKDLCLLALRKLRGAPLHVRILARQSLLGNDLQVDLTSSEREVVLPSVKESLLDHTVLDPFFICLQLSLSGEGG